MGVPIRIRLGAARRTARTHYCFLSGRSLPCKKTDLSQADASGQLLTPSQVCPRNVDGQLPAAKLPTFGGPPEMSAQFASACCSPVSTTTSHPLLPAPEPRSRGPQHLHFFDSQQRGKEICAIHSRAAGARPRTIRPRTTRRRPSIYIKKPHFLVVAMPQVPASLRPGRWQPSSPYFQARLKLQVPLPATSRAL